MVSDEANTHFHKYVEMVEAIFKNLPNPLKWQSFLVNDLISWTDIQIPGTPSLAQVRQSGQ